MNVRKYIVLIVFFLFYFQNHTLSNEEKTNLENFFSEKSIEHFQKEIQVFKKYKFSEPHWLEVDRLKLKFISECSEDENKNTELILESKKLLKILAELLQIESKDKLFQLEQRQRTSIHILELIGSSAYCYMYSNDENKKFYVNIVQSVIDGNLLTSEIIKKSSNSLYIDQIWMPYSVNLSYIFSNKLIKDLSHEKLWKYDIKILNIIKINSAKTLENLRQYLVFSNDRLDNDYSRPLLISYLSKIFEIYNLENKKNYSIFRDYFRFLINENEFDKCINFYNSKISNIKFNIDETLKQIQFLDYWMQCNIALLNFEIAIEKMNYKIEIIEFALDNFKFDNVYEKNLYNNLIRALTALAAGQTTYFSIEKDNENTKLINKAKKINRDYFFLKDKFEYYNLYINILERTYPQTDLNIVINEINSILLEIEKLGLDDYKGEDLGDSISSQNPLALKEDLFIVDKKRLESKYLNLYADILIETENYSEAVNLIKKNLNSINEIQKILKSDYLVQEHTIEHIDLISSYVKLYEIAVRFKDKKEQEKYSSFFEDYCKTKKTAYFYCIDYFDIKISSLLGSENLDQLLEANKSFEKIYSNLKIKSKYYSYDRKRKYLINKMYAVASINSKFLRENDTKSSEYLRTNKELCKVTEEIINTVLDQINFTKNNSDLNKDYINQLYYHLAGAVYIKEGITGAIKDCPLKDNLPDIKFAAEKIVEIQKEEIYTLANLTSNFSKYQINSKFISQLAATFAYNIDGLYEKEYADKKLKELFSLSQIGKNLYLTNSIKSKIYTENIEEIELKELVAQRNAYNKKLYSISKKIFNNQVNNDNQYEQFSNLKNKISDIEEKINLKFPDYFNKQKLKLYSLEDVQNVLNENEALLVFDSSDFYFTYIVEKNKFNTHFDNRVTNAGLRDYINKYRKLVKNHTIGKMENVKTHRETLKLFYEGLFKKIEKKLSNKIDKIYIITDNYTNDLPFGFFYDKNTNKYLIQKFSIGYTPSVGSFIELRKKKPKKLFVKNSNFLGIGNPNLSKVSQKKTFKDLSLFNLSTRGILKDKSLITDNFESIPYTKKEIKALSKYFKNRKILLSSDANENNLKSLDLFKFNIISFATHAAVSGSLEGTSEPFLVLTPPKISNEINDGILTASEITQLNLDADLVLLSACDTASKENQYSPGFSGLVASFIQAGSKNVLATHWPVADKATSIMVLETIKKVRKQKMEIVEALKLTKIEFINGKYGNKYKNPFYWAPYILIGS